MRLSDDAADRFYAAWLPLLSWVNDQRKVIPPFPPPQRERPLDIGDAEKVRDILWKDDPLRHEFVARNPLGVSAEVLALVASWDRRRAGAYTVLEHTANHTVFLGSGEGFEVLGLASSLDEILPPPPVMVEAVLLPFGDRIVTDGLMKIYNVHLGPGIRAGIKRDYRNLVERGAIWRSLLPKSAANAMEEVDDSAESSNRMVLRSFRERPEAKQRTPKVLERDMMILTALAEAMAPRPLRDCSVEDIEAAMGSASMFGNRSATRTGLKRFVKFLQKTERIVLDTADTLLDRLDLF